ncbi:MAG: serine/threonine-protein kinase [Gemmataceae bacterium]
MANPTIDVCPAPATLRDLLAGTAGPTVASHVESCPACQARLAALAGSPGSAPATLLDSHGEFLSKLGAGLSATAPPTIPGYEILEELGRGGVGVVYKARQPALDRIVALKVLLGSGHETPAELERFQAEARAAGRLTHPGIVRVYEVGEWCPFPDALPRPYLCLEYVPGGSLDRAIARTPQPPRAAATIVKQVAEAVEAAHQAGLVHRDLKPANILLSQEEPRTKNQEPTTATAVSWNLDLGSWSLRPKVADFGLAKRFDADGGQTQTGTILGTPSYMAPEQARGWHRDIGPRTDVFSLGAILYEMLTGRPPFQGPTPLETVMQVTRVEPLPPRRLQPAVPRDLETICLKCLEKPPDRRYPSAAALADDLGRYLDGRPILARPIGVFGRAVKLARRHPLPAALTGLTAAVIVGSVVALAYAFRESEAARRRAETARDGTAAMNAFLLDQILAAPRLGGEGKGRDVTVLQLVSAAAPKVDESFANQPEIAASVHDSFGQTFLQFGEYDRAVHHLARAADFYERTLGPDAEPTVVANTALGTTYAMQGQYERAAPMLERGFERLTSLRGPADERTLTARFELANARLKLRQVDAAETLYRDGLAICRAATGKARAMDIDALSGVSKVLGARNRMADALPVMREAADRAEAVYGPLDQRTIILRGYVGEAYFVLGDYTAAVPVLADTLEKRRRVISPTHPSTYTTQGLLADCWYYQRKIDEAEAAYREVLAGYLATMPADNPLIPHTRSRLAACLVVRGKFAEAEPLLLEANAALAKPPVTNPAWLRRNRSTLAVMYERWGKPEEAAKWKPPQEPGVKSQGSGVSKAKTDS